MAQHRNTTFYDRDTFSPVDIDSGSIPDNQHSRIDRVDRILPSVNFENRNLAVPINLVTRRMFNGTFQLTSQSHKDRVPTRCLQPTHSPLIYLRQNSHIPKTCCREYSSGYGLA